ncbi:hypothetical protein PIB30_083318 [Stylosanthes scabra]|uniref:Uncharacterized protein n=1 Tax=Stylosanthes scabra TaxID=79078 RepID=A0ABU6UUX6_9FABA|nr:hypothetical protein [Stylosanthes scabra]
MLFPNLFHLVHNNGVPRVCFATKQDHLSLGLCRFRVESTKVHSHHLCCFLNPFRLVHNSGVPRVCFATKQDHPSLGLCRACFDRPKVNLSQLLPIGIDSSERVFTYFLFGIAKNRICNAENRFCRYMFDFLRFCGGVNRFIGKLESIPKT